MRVLILGSAAGGGFPQWNSNAPNCRRARAGARAVRARTQASVAVSADGRHWFLLNASPDLRQQIEANPALHPVGGLRSSPIAGVVLTGGEVDAIAGLLSLRERQEFTISATASIHQILASNPIFGVLAPDIVRRRVGALDQTMALALPDGSASGLTVELFAVPGKLPLYLEGAGRQQGEDNAGAIVSHNGKRIAFVPGCARITPDLVGRLRGVDLLLFDGTLWRDDEMIQAGLGAKTGARMGHVSVSGPDGVLRGLSDLDGTRKILIHINNSNPILDEDSKERAAVEAAGWEVAFDGMELEL